MTIDYVKLSPTGNITVLVRTPVPRARQAGLAAALLADGRVGGEQVGYIEPPAQSGARARLQMMGGEFCGNATMALGALLARDAGLAEGGSLDMPLEVSGCEGPVPCRICREGAAWIGTVRMPLPTRIDEITLDSGNGPLNVPLVRLPGIAHLILDPGLGLDEARLRRLLPEWNLSIGADALGALVWNEAARAIDPLVYVPSAGTLVRETGCGSGSAAVGSWLAWRAGQSAEADIAQPGGVIRVAAGFSGGVFTRVTITGRVEVLDEGTVEIEA